jgi:hypothetical protein
MMSLVYIIVYVDVYSNNIAVEETAVSEQLNLHLKYNLFL